MTLQGISQDLNRTVDNVKKAWREDAQGVTELIMLVSLAIFFVCAAVISIGGAHMTFGEAALMAFQLSLVSGGVGALVSCVIIDLLKRVVEEARRSIHLGEEGMQALQNASQEAREQVERDTGVRMKVWDGGEITFS